MNVEQMVVVLTKAQQTTPSKNGRQEPASGRKQAGNKTFIQTSKP